MKGDFFRNADNIFSSGYPECNNIQAQIEAQLHILYNMNLSDSEYEKLEKSIYQLDRELFACYTGGDSIINRINNELRNLGLTKTNVNSEQISMHDDSVYFNFGFNKLYSIPIRRYLKNIYYKQFDELLLIRTFRSTQPNTVTAIVSFSTMNNTIRIDTFQHVLNSDHGFQSVKPVEINLGGNMYSMFPTRIKFQDYRTLLKDSKNKKDSRVEEHWIICGLVKSSIYDAQVRSIELSVLVFLVLITFFILISMPILKLLIMSAIERLKIFNVWFAGFSIIVGTALLMILLLFASGHQGGKAVLDKNLSSLALSIEANLNMELRQSLGLLDSLYRLDSISFNNLKNKAIRMRMQKSKRGNGSIIPNAIDSTIISKKSRHNIFFNEAFWLSKSAKQKLTLTTHPQEIDRDEANLSHRSYFKDAKNNSNLNETLLNNNSIHFSLQSIASNRNYTREAGVGIPVNLYNSIYVIGLATKLHSVMDPLLPTGFQFGIIDAMGEVWFHSKKELNLQENFFAETGNNHQLETLVKGRTRNHIDINYHGQSYRAYVTPIYGTQLSLIVFQDKTYYSEPYIHAISHGLLLVGLLFTIMGITLIVLFVSTYQATHLKIKRFFLNWLRPRTNWLIIKNKNQIDPYGISIVVQTILFLFFLILYLIFGVEAYLIVVVLTLPVYFLLFHYLLFEVRAKQTSPFIGSSAFWFSLGSIVILGLVHLIAYEFVDHFWATIVIELTIVLIAIIGIYRSKWILSILGNRLQEYLNSNNRRYLAMLRLWLITTTVVPVFFFYQISTEMQFEAWSKFELLQIARSTDSRLENYRKEFEEVLQLFAKSDTSLYAAYINYADRYGNYLQEEMLSRDTCNWVPMAENKLCDLIFTWRFQMSSENDGSRQAIFPKASDNRWKWMEKEKTDSIKIIYTDWKNATNVFATKKQPFMFFRGEYTIFYLLTFILAGLIINKAIRVAAKLIFGLGLINRSSKTNDRWIKNITVDSKLFLVGLPHSFKNNQLKKVKDEHSSIEFDELDFGSINKRFKSLIQTDRIYIIRHFELSINNHEQNVERYELLNKMISTPNTGIIISSSVQPSVIYDFYELAIDSALSNKDLKDRDLKITEYKKYIRLWKNLLSGFTMEYSSLVVNEGSTSGEANILDSELSFGSYLPTLRNKWSAENESSLNSEDFILEVEEHADTYYHSLWNSFTEKEKYLLYDLAVDRYVNMRNLKLIRILMNKGVIVMEDSLRIMNKSFNNFIISSVNQEEQNRMDKEVSKSGTWDTVQLVLILTIVAVTIFISIAQKNWLEDFNALITAVAGVTALLLRFGGLFSVKTPTLNQ